MKDVRQAGAGQRGQARAVGDDAHALIGLGNSLRATTAFGGHAAALLARDPTLAGTWGARR
jgi:hypothetical protein